MAHVGEEDAFLLSVLEEGVWGGHYYVYWVTQGFSDKFLPYARIGGSGRGEGKEGGKWEGVRREVRREKGRGREGWEGGEEKEVGRGGREVRRKR